MTPRDPAPWDMPKDDPYDLDPRHILEDAATEQWLDRLATEFPAANDYEEEPAMPESTEELTTPVVSMPFVTGWAMKVWTPVSGLDTYDLAVGIRLETELGEFISFSVPYQFFENWQADQGQIKAEAEQFFLNSLMASPAAGEAA